MEDQDLSSSGSDTDENSSGAGAAGDEDAAAGAAIPGDEGQTAASAGARASQGEENLVIPDEVRANYPDLVELIKVTESMNDDERNYWFQTLLIMTDEQVENLRQILTTEKQNLTAIDTKAQEDINEINRRQVAEWKEFEQKEKKKVIKEAEKMAKEKEKGEQEALLDELENI